MKNWIRNYWMTTMMIATTVTLYLTALSIMIEDPTFILGYATLLLALFASSLTFSTYGIEKEWSNEEGV